MKYLGVIKENEHWSPVVDLNLTYRYGETKIQHYLIASERLNDLEKNYGEKLSKIATANNTESSFVKITDSDYNTMCQFIGLSNITLSKVYTKLCEQGSSQECALERVVTLFNLAFENVLLDLNGDIASLLK